MKQEIIEKQFCHWRRCNNIVYVKQLSKMFHIVEFCTLHKLAYKKQCELIKQLDPKRHYSQIANELFITNKKKYQEIKAQAVKLAKMELKRI